MEVTWRDVVGYEGIYEVSDSGEVRTHENKTTYTVKHGVRRWKQRTLKQKVSKDKTCRVNLWRDGKEATFLVHRLVAYAFLPSVEGKNYVNHIDGSRLNNAVTNLEWCNHTENNNHAFDTGLIKTATKIKLTNEETGEEFDFRSMAHASKFLGKNQGYISKKLTDGITSIQGYKLN